MVANLGGGADGMFVGEAMEVRLCRQMTVGDGGWGTWFGLLG